MSEDPSPRIGRDVTGAVTEIRPGRRVSLAVREAAQPNGTTLFFCHGAGGAKNQWRAQWAAFADSGARLVAWDFPGHGESPAPRRAEVYAGAELVADFQALIARYGNARNIIAAHSLGTRITLALLQAPEPPSVESAVLLGAPAPSFGARGNPIASWPLPVLWLMRPMLHAGFAKAAWSRAADPALVAFEQKETEANTLFMMQSLMRGAVALDAARLGALALPVRILAGAEDGLTPPAGGEALAKALPNAAFEVLPECGHQIMLERPAETNAAIRAALAGAALTKRDG